MKILGLILITVFCAILVANCDESHHIDQRILENKDTPYYAISEDNPNNKNDSNLIPSIENSSSPQQVIPTVLNATPQENATISPAEAISTTRFNVSSLLRTNNISDQNTTISPAEEVSTTRFNVSSLLRTNDSDQLFINVGVIPIDALAAKQNETETNNNSKVDTEVKDLMQPDPIQVENHQHPLDPLEPLHIPDKIDKQTELIEDGDNTEDVLRRHRDENVDDCSSQGTMLAIVMVSVFVGLSVLCYASLLVWRNYLENRYGSRTLLVEAEEFDDPNNDLKHFSI